MNGVGGVEACETETAAHRNADPKVAPALTIQYDSTLMLS